MPSEATDVGGTPLASMISRVAADPSTIARPGTLLDDPRPYIYSAIRSAAPRGGRLDGAPPPAPLPRPRNVRERWRPTHETYSVLQNARQHALPPRPDAVSKAGKRVDALESDDPAQFAALEVNGEVRGAGEPVETTWTVAAARETELSTRLLGPRP